MSPRSRQLLFAAATPVEPAPRGLIESVTLPPDKKLIALTFDLCEESGYVSGYDGRIVDLLRAEGIKATCSPAAKWIEETVPSALPSSSPTRCSRSGATASSMSTCHGPATPSSRMKSP